jgi:nucleotide-binding universal stress UspA family protein
MLGKVLVPTDFSEDAKKILLCLTRIPGIKEIVLQHVVDATHYSRHGWTHEPHIRNAKIQLREEKDLLENLGFAVTVAVDVITSGDIATAIISRAKNEDVSFIIMGSRGRGLIRGLLLGSVSSDVLRYGKTHLLLMRHDHAGEPEGAVFDRFCSGLFQRVLYPTDFSEPAEYVLSFIKDLEALGEVHVLHVVTKGETQEEVESNVLEATRKLEQMKSDLAGAGLSVKTHVRLGRPTDEISSLAEGEEISLVLMSSHGKGFLTGLLVGSTTLGVAIHTNRPLMVIRPAFCGRDADTR